ncbi:hypothetical protein GJAV_G00078610 [Gymnothorax javanicus]|nr:hypothetical protein GJAV_G00078610 [Gymnothorax javanicus]
MPSVEPRRDDAFVHRPPASQRLCCATGEDEADSMDYKSRLQFVLSPPSNNLQLIQSEPVRGQQQPTSFSCRVILCCCSDRIKLQRGLQR